MNEIWKDIKGYENLYQVSNLGRVKSLNRTQRNSKNVSVSYNGKILKQFPNSKGYMRTYLKKDHEQKMFFVHRLVALHFVENPNPDTFDIVNHLDSDFLNNTADNLEWTDLKGNSQHALKNGRLVRTKEWKENLKKAKKKDSKAVIGTNIITGDILYFERINDCAKAGFQPSCVCNCCKGIRQKHKGYRWKYEKEGD